VPKEEQLRASSEKLSALEDELKATPEENRYVHEAMANLNATSRTAQGTLDVSSTEGKADMMATASGEEAAAAAKRNVAKVFRELYRRGEKMPMTGQGMAELIDDLAMKANKGILKPDRLMREKDTRFPNQTRAADLATAHAQFAEELVERLSDKKADPIETAAWIEWRANLMDHFWADGVGKTSKALAAWPLMRDHLPLPAYPPNKEFVAYAKDVPRGDPANPKSYLGPGWERFNNAYHNWVESKTLKAMIDRGAPSSELAQHPMVKRAVAENRRRVPTGTEEDFANPTWRANRVYDFDGEKVKGMDAAIARLTDQARAYAGEGGVRNEKRAVVIIGPPAAGKSSAANPIAKHYGAAIPNPDDVKLVIPEYEKGVGTSAVHEESSVMGKEMVKRLIAEGANVVLPKVGDRPESIRRAVNELRELGYQVDLAHVGAPTELVARRNIARFLNTGRLVDPEYVAAVGDKPHETYHIINSEGLVHDRADIDSSVPGSRVLEATGDLASALRGMDGGALEQRSLRGDQGGRGPAESPGGPGEGQGLSEGYRAFPRRSYDIHTDLGPWHPPPGPLGRSAQDYLIAKGRETGLEHLLVVDRDGSIVAHGRGSADNVGISPHFEDALFDPNRGMVLHHNHPRNTPLSDSDLAHLAFPGLKAIWAHGHNGNVTRAELTPAGSRLVSRVTTPVGFQALRQAASDAATLLRPTMRGLIDSAKLSHQDSFETYFHMISRAMQRAGVIAYDYTPHLDRHIDQLGLDPYIDQAARVINGSLHRATGRSINAPPGLNHPAQPVYRHPGDLGATFGGTSAPPIEYNGPGRDDFGRRENNRGAEALGLPFREHIVGLADVNRPPDAGIGEGTPVHAMQKRAIYGLPLNPLSALEQLRGASFCVSYGTRKKLGRQLDDAIRLVGHDGMLLVDNGAYSLHNQGKTTLEPGYVEDFEKWAQGILDRSPQAVAVIPDVIGGTEEQNQQMVIESQLPTDRAMPIWHMHESLDYLKWLVEGWGFNHLGIGSSGDYGQPGTPQWHARINEALDTIKQMEDEGTIIRPRIHMMRAQAQAHLYPFDSSDSTNVAINHNAWRRRNPGPMPLARMAGRIDDRIQASATGTEAEHQVLRPHPEPDTGPSDADLYGLMRWFQDRYEFVPRQPRLPGFEEGKGLPAPTFYSAVERAVTSAKQDKASPNAWLGMIKNTAGVKPEEIQWLGLEDWLRDHKGPVSKAELADYVQAHKIEVREVEKGGSGKFPIPTDIDDWKMGDTQEEPDGEGTFTMMTPEGVELPGGAHIQVHHDDNGEVAAYTSEGPNGTDPHDTFEQAARQLATDLGGTVIGTKYAQYTLPGGKNYRELLLTLPSKGKDFKNLQMDLSNRLDIIRHEYSRVHGQEGEEALARRNELVEEADAVRHQLNELYEEENKPSPDFKSSHWDEPNVLAHIRFDDRTGPNGERILHMAEVQSDWHQKGRKEGYRLDPARRAELQDENSRLLAQGIVGDLDARLERQRQIEKKLAPTVPDAPFKTTWPELALKRMIRYAAENGYDRLTWDTGQTSAERYDLRKHIGQVVVASPLARALPHSVSRPAG
jgi:predicted kinase